MAAEMKEERGAMFSCYSTAEEVTEGIDASDKTILITGATSGVGTETARVLAMRGARVVLAVRNLNAGDCTKSSILQETPHARLHVLHLDLSSMISIRTFCDTFKSLKLPLNILMNNAGVLKSDFELSKDGFETHFAINHLGHFLLTSLLLEEMKKASIETGIQGKIINVSSLGHRLFTKANGIQFETINDKLSFDPLEAYGKSKLANILYANELARRFKEDGVNMVANSLHPGVILNTLIFRDCSEQLVQKIVDLASAFKPIFMKTISQGAATQCFLAIHPSVETCSGKYFEDCKEENPRSDFFNNENLAKELWDFSIRATSSMAY